MRTHDNGPAFSAHEVTKVYTMGEVQVHALRGVDLELRPSELVVLLGRRGISRGLGPVSQDDG